MVRKLAAMLLAAGLSFSIGAYVGAEEIGAVHVWLDPGDNAVTRGEVALYQVGWPTEQGYQIAENYGGGMVRMADALSPYLAQWLAQMDGKVGATRLLDADGRAEFSRTPDGLYLLVQTESMEGFYSIRPTMVTVPDEGVREVVVKPVMRSIREVEPPPATGDHFSPLATAMVLVLSGLGVMLCIDRLRREE